MVLTAFFLAVSAFVVVVEVFVRGFVCTGAANAPKVNPANANTKIVFFICLFFLYTKVAKPM